MLTSRPLAFSPGSITCFFTPKMGHSAADTYSRGCAINLSHGVEACVRTAKESQTCLNGEPVTIAPVQNVIGATAPEPVVVEFETPLPIGCGFGVSAACCLTAAFAIAKHFDLPLSRHELGMIAHQAEVAHRTGLGDVAAQLCGGIVFRRCQSGPLDAMRLPIRGHSLYYRAYGRLSTPEVLGDPDALETIVDESKEAIDWLESAITEVTLESLLDRSLMFASNAGFVEDARLTNAIEQIYLAGGHATVAMLGQSVVATRPAPGDDEWTLCGIDEMGTRWLI